jgi:hypothetical protein
MDRTLDGLGWIYIAKNIYIDDKGKSIAPGASHIEIYGPDIEIKLSPFVDGLLSKVKDGWLYTSWGKASFPLHTFMTTVEITDKHQIRIGGIITIDIPIYFYCQLHEFFTARHASYTSAMAELKRAQLDDCY